MPLWVMIFEQIFLAMRITLIPLMGAGLILAGGLLIGV